ncbi:hypothetical protein PR202_gb05915 [Eleusine coracana subsp. coracana]|uniref:Uncharacterized protein n=1 Tax=Eleusine coracana subsp. coracana TaxID=191504 RepID=A0AAV5E7H8_ELECO|nr:hypothetical protein PR202_gb05915 [Eleusine coracana subsp. coracana]
MESRNSPPTSLYKSAAPSCPLLFYTALVPSTHPSSPNPISPLISPTSVELHNILPIAAASLLADHGAFHPQFVNLRKRLQETGNGIMVSAERKGLTLPPWQIIAVCNASITSINVGFSVLEAWKHQNLSLSLIISSVSWLLVTFFSLYCKNKGARIVSNWPRVLVSWWVFSFLSESILTSLHLLDLLNSVTIVDFVSLPFCIIICLCLVVTAMRTSKRGQDELNQPLLIREQSCDCSSDRFSSSGWWSQLTFQWLNPVFEKGYKVRLELEHIPSVPQSETAEQSYALLQETLHKQKPEPISLQRAIICSVWTPLIINAVFAVELLSDKTTDKGHGYGYILAVLFFISKTIESLSQRQWYFGARRIGFQVRAALMVSIYKKSLLMKNSATGTGKIINFLDVDVEKVVFATVLVMVSNTPLAKSQRNLNMKIMEAKDSRIKATAEALKSMRILKLHAWETAYLDRLLKLRDTERGWIRRYLYTCSAIAFLFWASPTLVSVVTFGICILLELPLSAGTVLAALATFRVLQDPIYNLPELVSMVTQTRVSLYRIEEFIKEDNHGKASSYGSRGSTDKQFMAGVVDIEPGEYSWEAADNILKKTSFAVKIDSKVNIKTGQKVAVCGPVGSGKSSLLCAILGEIPRVSGSGTTVIGLSAYVPQSAWIQTGTVQDNVLFGKAMDKPIYDEALQGCALDKDVALWANGDMTLVEERGINLSGGQKQRIQLARALYSDADVYLLDDPFSAVDAHTGAHLFKECLMRQMSSKTVIYVTHQLEFLRDADLVLVMKDGRIVQSGKYDDLMVDQDGELSKQMDAHNQSLSQVTPAKVHGLARNKKCKKKQMELTEIQPDHNVLERESEEERVSGPVKWNIYRKFVTSAYNGALIPIIIGCQVLFQALQICSNYWIAWASERQEQVSREKMIGIFVMLSAGSSAFILCRAFVLTTIAIETAQKLFLAMTKNIFRAPISFFDSTPSSRILNRAYYICSARELARLVGIKKAPVLHHFSETVSGAATIRCFNQGENFFRKSLKLIDDYSRITFHNSATMEWLCVRINFLFNLVFFVMLVILVSLPRDTIDPSLAGLAATYGLNLNVLQAWVIWNLCNVENKMISVERIMQFSSIPSESPLVIEDYRPDEKWPWYGTIQIDDLQIKYKHDMPMVLKVGEDGGNWSGGQRQLVCLARALLMKRKILVLDEATASVDTATDNIIQRTIRQETKSCTVITIAHRIPTVIDSDLILVLGEGRILEYDSPDNLLRDESSAFLKVRSKSHKVQGYFQSDD